MLNTAKDFMAFEQSIFCRGYNLLNMAESLKLMIDGAF